MRSESVYQIECLCGRTFERPRDESFTCPSCGRILVIDFRGTKTASTTKPGEGEETPCHLIPATTN